MQRLLLFIPILLICLSCQIESVTEVTNELFNKSKIEGNGEGVWGLVVSSKSTVTPGEVFDVHVSGGQAPYQIILDQEQFEVVENQNEVIKVKVRDEASIDQDFKIKVIDSNGEKGETTIRILEIFLDQTSMVLPTNQRGAGVSLSDEFMCVSAASDSIFQNEQSENNGSIIYRKINGLWKFVQSINEEAYKREFDDFMGMKPDYYKTGGGQFRNLGLGTCYVHGEYLVVTDETTVFRENASIIDDRGMISLFKWNSAQRKFILKQLIYPELIRNDIESYTYHSIRNKLYFDKGKLIFPLYNGSYSLSDKVLVYNLHNDLFVFEQLVYMDRTYATLGNSIEIHNDLLALIAKPNKWYEDKKYGARPKSLLVFKKDSQNKYEFIQKLEPENETYNWQYNSFAHDFKFSSEGELFISHPNSLRNGLLENTLHRYKFDNNEFQLLDSIQVRIDQFVFSPQNKLFAVNLEDKTLSVFDSSSNLKKIYEFKNIDFKYVYSTNGYYNTYSLIDWGENSLAVLSGENLLQVIEF